MYDAIIVGAGPAGGTLASLLAGLNVLVLEKEKDAPLKDSGLVSMRFREFVDDDTLIDSYVSEMEAVSPSGDTFLLRSDKPYAMLLKRKRFAYHLRIKAKENADVRYERVRGFHVDGGVTVETSKGTHEAKIIIGCDGTLSDVRKIMGIAPPAMVPGIFARTKQNLGYDGIKVFFNKFFSPDFFSWIIPQENEYGIMSAARPRDHFNDFRKAIDAPEGEIHSSMIPIGTVRSYGERALLVGEACGQAKPLTGGGIVFSMRAARAAATAIREATARNRFDAQFLSRYEASWKKELQWEITKQLFLRRIYRKMSNADIDKLFSAFGEDVGKINHFDYDHITSSWMKMPKGKMLLYGLMNLHLI